MSRPEGAEGGQGGDVHGELAEGHGLLVTLEFGDVFGDAIEDTARHGDFHVVVLEEDF
jgi:GTPase involved in cell partitioning and DNA repair